MMAARGERGARRGSFGGPATAANSAGGAVEGSGDPQGDFPPFSRGDRGARRGSFGGPATAANSAGGAVEGSGDPHGDFPPVSSRIERSTNVSVELEVHTWRPHTSVTMAGRGEGGARRGSFGGPATAANSAGGVVEGSGDPQGDFPPASRQQGGTSSHSASQREGSNRFTSSCQQQGVRGNYNTGEGRHGHGNESGSSTGRGRRSIDPIEALGRCMTGILRHQAANYKLDIKNNGYVLVSDLLKLSKKTAAGKPLSSHTEDDVRKAVNVDNKKRFGLAENSEGALIIRAVQGHTIRTVEAEHLLTSIADPSEVPVCVHGTSEKAWDIIQKEGLKPMTRNHIHFATGLPKEDGVISGMRVTSQVRIYLDVEKAMKDGMKFYISENKVVLTEGIDGGIPPKYFKKVRKLQADGKEEELELPHDESVANIAAEPKAEPRRTLLKKLPKNTDCVYCTNEKEMTTFWEEGLNVSKVSTDKFIHFATAVPKEESSTRGAGKRVAIPVFIHLDFDKAVAAGMELYLQDKEFVTEGTDGVISSDFFKRVYKKLPNGSEVILRPFFRKAKEQC